MGKWGLREALCAQNATRTARVGWSDEFRIGLMGSVRRVLTPRGMKVRQRVELSRDWYWLAVAVVYQSGVMEDQWIGGLSGEKFLPVLRDWHEAGMDVLV
jgi:hypothetical protein